MTAQIIPFPKRPEPDHTSLIHLSWTGIEVGPNKCSEFVHYFVDKSETCQCGEERWPPRPGA